MDMNIIYLYWILPLPFLYYYIVDTTKNWTSTGKYPVAGDLPVLAPRFVLNFIFATRASRICRDSYQKFKDQVIQLIRTDGNVLVLPYNLLEELSSLPTTIASPSDGIENDLMGKYTSISLILDSRLQHSVVQRRLTPRIPVLVPMLEKAVTSAFKLFPQADDWVEVTPYELFGKISARVNASALVGPSFSENIQWLEIAFEYAENLMQTMLLLRIFPRWMQPVVATFLPSYWRGRHSVRKAREILSPKIQELIEANDRGIWDPTYSTKEDDTNVLSWLAGSTKGSERNPASIVHVQILLSFASVHTTLTRIVNSLYDIMATDPSLADELRSEIETVAIDAKGWNDVPYDRLHKLDSTLRESQRTSPTTLLGMKRLFKKPYTFRNGTHIPQGTYTTMMVSEIENDPEHTPRPEVFDALRSYREKYALGFDSAASKDIDFSAATRTALGFGYGRTACPGRFFASVVIKMVFVKLLTEYEFRFLPAAVTNATIAPPPPTSQISWPSSPQHHMFPPEKSQNLKRESPNHIPPPAKKRTLPKTWAGEAAKASRCNESESPFWVGPSPDLSTTPLPKKERGLPWDATQSAVKAQRKQLKSQSKKSDPEAHLSPEEMRTVADEHVTKRIRASAISLSSEQQHVMDLVTKKAQSVFFTGPAGTGKSVLMRAIISDLKKNGPGTLNVSVFAGIGLGKEDVPTLVKKIRRNAKAKNRWLRTKTLIIDEVSMVDGDLFDKLSEIARTIRKNGRAFGGIQLIITGDFFQLPPVPDGGKKEAKFAFDAATWNTSIDHTIGLTQVFRQKDPQFAGMLNEMRLGRISSDTVQTLKDLARPLTFDDGLDVTELFPTRYEVERSNETRLRSLPGETYHYESQDTGDPNVRDKLLANMMAPKSMDLKKGAQVMLIKNMDDTLVNGSLGKVIGFMAEATFETWAMSEHNIGLDDEAAVEDSSKKKIKAYSRDAESMKDLREYPVVRFTATDGTHRVILCVPEDWKVELPTGEAQGQTLERVKVDLGKVFEKGQAYVALSRAVSKSGLQVLRFEKTKVMAHPKVIQFYNQLYSAEAAVKTKKTGAISEFAQKGVSSTLTGKKGEGPTVIDLDEEEAILAAYG
ncbi:hypothetical protein NUW58_g166 [Xylaria curta]|uniref:Uncharacterized protein n=1 Tax=Xylaria curta TaxID=42375 RepID=A0ACC1PT71_9PEZI|nr:hypothetical protein NUW58_g166 [Xylaria curta]